MPGGLGTDVPAAILGMTTENDILADIIDKDPTPAALRGPACSSGAVLRWPSPMRHCAAKVNGLPEAL